MRAAAAASTKSANDHRDSYLSELCQTAAHLPGVACCVLPPIPRRLCEISWRHWRNRRHCHTKCSPDLMANSLSLFSLSQGLPLPTCACRTFGAPAYKKPTASVPLSSIDVVEQRLVCVCVCVFGAVRTVLWSPLPSLPPSTAPQCAQPGSVSPFTATRTRWGTTMLTPRAVPSRPASWQWL